jgi:tRNA threonylcarbamoyladenosine biosynthesis protein TsaB
MKLGLDCTNGHLTWALLDDTHILYHETHLVKRDVAEYFPEALHHQLNLLARSPKDIEVIVSVAGPGGFSGVRTGTSFLEGLNAVLQVPIVTLSSLQALVLSVSSPNGNVITLLDAKRQGVYVAVYDEQYHPLVAEHLCDVDNVRAVLAPYVQKPYYLAGHGISLCNDLWQDNLVIDTLPCSRAEYFIKNYLKLPDIQSCLTMPHRPIYLRAPDAKLPQGKS